MNIDKYFKYFHTLKKYIAYNDIHFFMSITIIIKCHKEIPGTFILINQPHALFIFQNQLKAED